ncbi:MAG: hypothetical protein QXX99_02150 [Candidatus Bathyarchaeia archaeon]
MEKAIKNFKEKPKIVEMNVLAVRVAYEYAKKVFQRALTVNFKSYQ